MTSVTNGHNLTHSWISCALFTLNNNQVMKNGRFLVRKNKKCVDNRYAVPETNPELNKDLQEKTEIRSEDDLDVIYDEEWQQQKFESENRDSTEKQNI